MHNNQTMEHEKMNIEFDFDTSKQLYNAVRGLVIRTAISRWTDYVQITLKDDYRFEILVCDSQILYGINAGASGDIGGWKIGDSKFFKLDAKAFDNAKNPVKITDEGLIIGEKVLPFLKDDNVLRCFSAILYKRIPAQCGHYIPRFSTTYMKRAERFLGAQEFALCTICQPQDEPYLPALIYNNNVGRQFVILMPMKI